VGFSFALRNSACSDFVFASASASGSPSPPSSWFQQWAFLLLCVILLAPTSGFE
jgi:hypothetical protein